MTSEPFNNPKPLILVVDDCLFAQQHVESILSEDNDVRCVCSGEESIDVVSALKPDLIVLDIEMKGMDGYQTCLKLREICDSPILFLSSHDSIEERVKAYDSGGLDFVIKPADPEILKRKICKIIASETIKHQMSEARVEAEKLALSFLGDAGKTGALLNFMRDRLNVENYESLASSIVENAQDQGVHVLVQIRGDDQTITRSIAGEATSIEEEIVSKMATMGRQFQFKSRWVVNFEHVTILAKDVPEDEIRAGKIRDNLSILAECAEANTASVAVRRESAKHAEALQVAQLSMSKIRELYRDQHVETQIMLTELVSDVERKFVTMGLTLRQEDELSDAVRGGTDKILRLFDRGVLIDAEFDNLLASVSLINNPQNQNWLF